MDIVINFDELISDFATQVSALQPARVNARFPSGAHARMRACMYSIFATLERCAACANPMEDLCKGRTHECCYA
jgi:hypothetical protein